MSADEQGRTLLGGDTAEEAVASVAQGDAPWGMPADRSAAPAGVSWEGDQPEGVVPAVTDSSTGEIAIDFVESSAAPAGGAARAGPSAGDEEGAAFAAATERAVPAAAGGGGEADGGGNGKTSFYQLDHYARFFDVDTKEVLGRMLGAIFFQRDLFASIEAKPDLYGPFWTVTTVVFLLAMASNAVDWLASSSDDAWQGDLEKMVYAAVILYGYVFGAGLALWVWLKVISQAAISLPALWCIYGYSMTVFLPVALLAVVPSALFLWALCLVATLYSGVFLTLNLKQPVMESLVPARQAMTLFTVFGAHQVLAFLLRLYVLRYDA